MEEFTMSVEEGQKLAKRIYSGKERHTAAPPRQSMGMERSRASLLLTVSMMYAVIGDPVIVDNTDVLSYQPHIYIRYDSSVLIPL